MYRVPYKNGRRYFWLEEKIAPSQPVFSTPWEEEETMIMNLEEQRRFRENLKAFLREEIVQEEIQGAIRSGHKNC